MTIPQFILLSGLSLAMLCWIIAMIQLRHERQWCKCQTCKSYHRGNVKLAFLPTSEDGTVRDELCIQCSESKAFFESRERDIQERIKEFHGQCKLVSDFRKPPLPKEEAK